MTLVDWLASRRKAEQFRTYVLAVFTLILGGLLLVLLGGACWLGSQGLLWLYFRDWQAALPWSYALTPVLLAASLYDYFRSSSDDLNITIFWLFREVLHLAPWALVSGGRLFATARRMERWDIPGCARVLTFLARYRGRFPASEIRELFPEVEWTALCEQLGTIPGVLVGENPPRLLATEFLRTTLRGLKLPRITEEPLPEEDSTPETPVTPKTLPAHDLLGVSAHASVREIKSAYRQRMKQCHPDLFATADEATRQQAEEWAKALNAAYQTLMNQQVSR